MQFVDLLPFCKRDNFRDLLCTVFAQISIFGKGSTLKGKNLLATASKFFPFKVDPVSKGRQNNYARVVSHESVSISLNIINEMFVLTINNDRKCCPTKHQLIKNKSETCLTAVELERLLFTCFVGFIRLQQKFPAQDYY